MATPNATREKSYAGDYMAEGKHAERIIETWLRTRPEVRFVKNVSDDLEWQRAEVDFIVTYHTGNHCFYEAKSDNHLGVSGNVLFEALRVNLTAHQAEGLHLGWSARTMARTILMFAPSTSQLYEIDAAKLRAGFLRYAGEQRLMLKPRVIQTDRIKLTLAFTVPEAYCDPIIHDVRNMVRDLQKAERGS